MEGLAPTALLEEGYPIDSSPIISTINTMNTLTALPNSNHQAQAEVPPASDVKKSVPIVCWVILAISSFGVIMASISTSALIIAFPILLIDLNTTLTTMMWILLVVLLTIGSVAGIAGKLGDIFGQALLYKVGYTVFVAGSFGAGFSSSINRGYDLLACRVIIGFGAAFLFTNSSAILTNTFAPYGKVGMSQGIFQLSSALGMTLGPLLGGAFAETDWRWIFFWNVPLGLPCAILAWFIVQNNTKPSDLTSQNHLMKFDWIGAIFYPSGLILILLAMVQGVVPDPVLSQPGPLSAVIISGCICGLIFIVDQFYAIDPMIPPRLFLQNKIFSVTTLAGTCMGFARNSITYNMIFFLQGPIGMNPLDAGVALIPFGIGTMVAGFTSGALSDKLGIRVMAALGPLVTMAAVAAFISFTEKTTLSVIGGVLFLSGFGIGLFGSPNSTSMMLSVKQEDRGVASAVSIITLMFTGMLGIVLTFSFVLNSMSQQQLFTIFISGGSSLSSSAISSVLNALRNDYYIVLVCCLVATISSLFNTFDVKKDIAMHAKIAADALVNDLSAAPAPKMPGAYVTVNENHDHDDLDHPL